MPTYFAILTATGEAKLANATALGQQLQIAQLAVGDGNGNLPVPDRNQVALVKEVRRAPLNQLSADPLNASQIIAEQVIPENVGGWWIRELGLFDVDGDLVAVANCPPTYKPQLAEGSGRTQVVRMVLIVSSTQAVQLKIDPAVVLATRKYADDAILTSMTAHLNAADPHPQYMTQAESDARYRDTSQWLGKAIGEIFYLQDDLAGVSTPPTNNADFRFIKLTANDAYNTGVLASEAVTGSAPYINATANISLAASPLHGRTIRLINTERRFLRAGSAGTLEDDSFKSHRHGQWTGGQNRDHIHSTVIPTVANSGSNFGASGNEHAEGGPGTVTKNSYGASQNHEHEIFAEGGTETKPRNIGVTAYMRIK